MASSKKTKPSPKKPAKKSPKIFKISKNKPESTHKAHNAEHLKPAKAAKQSGNWLKHNLGWILALIMAIASLGFLISMGLLYFEQKDDEQFYKDLQAKNDLSLREINAKKELIGNKGQLESEITNFQSAPDDLRDWVLRDYAVFKSKCIVNGEFIGPTTYEIANVVYDGYAKILMNCEGEDAQIVAKIGGRWVVVHSGQAAPNCNDVNSLAIPQGVAATCTDGKVLYPNPNP